MGISGVSSTIVRTFGSYVGDDGTNKPIAHALGRRPEHITITMGTGGRTYMIMGQAAWIAASVGGTFAVTQPTATNFYVGNPGDESASANAAGVTYYWVAI